MSTETLRLSPWQRNVQQTCPACGAGFIASEYPEGFLGMRKAFKVCCMSNDCPSARMNEGAEGSTVELAVKALNLIHWHATVDFWCRDCQDGFRAAPHIDVHAEPTPCPRCNRKNTYPAWTEGCP